MTFISLVLYLPGIIAGFLIAHWLWPERSPYALLLKLSLGIGLGMGISSIIHYIGLLVVPGGIPVLWVMLVLMILLLGASLLRLRAYPFIPSGWPRPTRLQWGLIALALLSTGLMLAAYAALVQGQPQGAFDAWAIWNRAARFIHRDPAGWQAALSPALYWANHPDYPLLIPLNTAWAWDTLGSETPRVPAVQALLFLTGGLGLVFSALGLTRSLGQAALGALALSATPFLTFAAAGLLADVPVMYYITAASVLMYLGLTRADARLLALAGFAAGLAGWTKNEGLLFILACVLGLTLTRSADLWPSLRAFAAGLAIPLAVVLSFKSLAPPSDLFGGGAALHLLTNPARWLTLLRALGGMALRFGDWPLSLPLALAVYALVVRTDPPPASNRSFFTIGAIIALQFLGSCAVYLLTPYDLQWHLNTSLGRVLLQSFPAALFLLLLRLREPESIFA